MYVGIINDRTFTDTLSTGTAASARVIRFHLAAVLKRKGWTPYRLARQTGLTVPTAYRLADPELRFGRFTADTLDRLCATLGVQPGELIDWVPNVTRRARAPVRVRPAAAPSRHRATTRTATYTDEVAPCSAD